MFMSMSRKNVLTLKAALCGVALFAISAVNVQAASFTAIRIGDIDGFGFGDGAGFVNAEGDPVNNGAGGVLGSEHPAIGDFLPDLNSGGGVLTGDGDDFDNRSAAEVLGDSLGGAGYTDNGLTTGSHYTDISLSTSYDASSAAVPGEVYNANTDTYGAGGAFPDGDSAVPNQPGFVFDFSVVKADIVEDTDVFFNLIFGDYEVGTADIKFTFTSAPEITLVMTPQTNGDGEDGLIQSSSLTLDFDDVFADGGATWDGYVEVDFIANTEPYTAFDFAELSVTPIEPNVVPLPAAAWMALPLLGGLGVTQLIRRKQLA